jgi:hypothetical protein
MDAHKAELDLPKPPAAVRELNDLRDRDRAIDIWRAASGMFRAIDEWREWLHKFEENGDADPAVAIGLQYRCQAAIATLSGSCSSQFFRDHDVEELNGMLPPIPLNRDWQDDRRFVMELGRSGEQSWTLQGECSKIVSLLEQQPTTVLGQEPFCEDDLPWHEPGSFWFNGQKFDLTPLAYKLLVFLVDSRREAHTAQQIAEGIDLAGESPKDHIASVRKVLREAAGSIEELREITDPIPCRASAWRLVIPKKFFSRRKIDANPS